MGGCDHDSLAIGRGRDHEVDRVGRDQRDIGGRDQQRFGGSEVGLGAGDRAVVARPLVGLVEEVDAEPVALDMRRNIAAADHDAVDRCGVEQRADHVVEHRAHQRVALLGAEPRGEPPFAGRQAADGHHRDDLARYVECHGAGTPDATQSASASTASASAIFSGTPVISVGRATQRIPKASWISSARSASCSSRMNTSARPA